LRIDLGIREGEEGASRADLLLVLLLLRCREGCGLDDARGESAKKEAGGDEEVNADELGAEDTDKGKLEADGEPTRILAFALIARALSSEELELDRIKPLEP